MPEHRNIKRRVLLGRKKPLRQELKKLQQRVAQLEHRNSESVQLAHQKALFSVVTKIRQSLDLETIFHATVSEVRQLLTADRVAIFRFNPLFNDGRGTFVSEDVLPQFCSILDEEIPIQCFREWYETQQNDRAGANSNLNNLNTDGTTNLNTDGTTNGNTIALPDCYRSVLARFQVQANLVVPLLASEKLWGLLCIHQCSSLRQWQTSEIEFVDQIAVHLGVALQQAELLEKAEQRSTALQSTLETQLRQRTEELALEAERERAIARMIEQIRQTLEINTIFDTTTREVRKILACDRVAVYQFASDWSGEFVSESVAPNWIPLVCDGSRASWCDSFLQETQGGRYRHQEALAVNDIYETSYSDCHLKRLEQLQVRAFIAVPVCVGETLWGLLVAYQNAAPRVWEAGEVRLLFQIGAQLGVALQQTQLLEQAKNLSAVLQNQLEEQLRQRTEELAKEAERERAIAQVIEKIRQTLDIETIFQTTATEVRRLLNADRVAMLRFDPGSRYTDGQFVSEDVLPAFTSALTAKVHDHCFGEHHASHYQHGRIWAVDDIEQANLLDCHVAILSRFQVRANLVAPLLKGDVLWGLLCIHQCAAPRQWQAEEIEFVTQIAGQLGVALQQAELLAQARHQSAELQRAKEAADAANQAKSDFLAKISHELRTPLNAILGFTQLLIRDGSLNLEQQEYLDIINRSGEHLLSLINDVLEMSKIEAGQVTLNEQSFDLYNLLDNLEEMLQLKAHSKGLNLIFDRASNVPQYLYADENKLRQILINLLSNAIKFTQTGHVILRVEQRQGEIKQPSKSPPAPLNPVLHFEVEDTGSGIDPSEIEALFQAFVQAEPGRRSQEGTGLGLPISRQFVRLMGGDIAVQTYLGQGSVFSFNIPIHTNEFAVVLPQSQQQVIGLVSHQPTCRILVVEDKRENRQLLVKLLTDVGFSVREAENGQEAIVLWESWKPHLIWMDMQMPVMDGYEATRQIRMREQVHRHLNPSIIIALTAHAFEENRGTIMAAGCDDLVTKPFREDILFSKIAHYLNVQYCYRDVSQTKWAEDAPTPDPSHYREALLTLPHDWLLQLHQAAMRLDDELILDLVAQLPQANVAVAIALTNWVKSLRFDLVMELVEQLNLQYSMS